MSTLNAGETLQPFKPLTNNLIFDSSGNLVGIQNDRANGNDFRIGGGSGVDGTFATLVATTALKINSGATLDLYNTADQTTNYERLRANWNASVAQIYTQQGGTGSQRALQIGISSTAAATTPVAGLTISGNAPFTSIGWLGASSTNAGPFVGIAQGTFTAASGTQTLAVASPTINQSGTAGYTALDINPTETATGGGTKLLQRWAVGGVALAYVTNFGSIYTSANLGAVVSFGLCSTLGTLDVTLNRDAADSLALRRSTNAQTFRVYNTYTDGSNGEYLQCAWSGNIAYVRTMAQGTGVNRSLVIGTFGASSLYFQTNSVTKWEVSSSGHFLTIADNTCDIGASGANRPRNIYVGGSLVVGSRIYMGSATVAGLPSAASSQYGHMFVTDSSVAASGNFGAIVAGGGANTVPVYSDGTNWRIG